MRVLITGADGFIGRHLVSYVLEVTDWDVVALDVRHTVNYPSRVTNWYCDLTKPMVLPEVNVDAVVNLASHANVSSFLVQPAELMRDNVAMTLTMLEWARQRRLTHFVQVSTNEVYGPSYASEPMREWSPIRPPTPYSASKAAQEAACVAWWYTYGVPVVILNAMHVFGEGQPAERFIPQAITALRAGTPVKVYGKEYGGHHWVSSKRNWLYVRNLADAIVWNLMRPVNTSEDVEFPTRFNVGGPLVGCNEIVKRLARLLDVDEFSIGWTDVKGARPGHELIYEIDRRSIYDAGWRGPFSFDEGLRRTVALWEDK